MTVWILLAAAALVIAALIWVIVRMARRAARAAARQAQLAATLKTVETIHDQRRQVDATVDQALQHDDRSDAVTGAASGAGDQRRERLKRLYAIATKPR